MLREFFDTRPPSRIESVPLMHRVRTGGRESLVNPSLLVLLRERSGLTVRGLARRSGVAPSTISRIERGMHLARPATVNALAKGLGVANVEILK